MISGESDDALTGSRLVNTLDCPVCGAVRELRERKVLSEELCRLWELDDAERHAINRREGDICVECGNSLRLLSLARTILNVLRDRYEIEVEAFPQISERLREAGRDLAVWECNNLSVLHPHLQGVPGLVYTEYGSVDEQVPSADLSNLGFQNESFDLILMTDVLEHVPDLDRALCEMARVLKKDGTIVLTVPVLMNRATRKRATIAEDGRLRHGLEPAYHGGPGTVSEDMLVVHEFGSDVVPMLERHFRVELHNEEELPFGTNTVFVLSGKESSESGKKGEERDMEDSILRKKWFYPFELPSGAVTPPYVPDYVAPVHPTRSEMMFAALNPLYDGRWGRVRCLDLACNQGYFSMLLARRGCSEVLGIEARQETVDEANLMRDCLGLDNARYVHGDVMALKGDEYEPFDVVLMLGLIYHLENPVGALRIAKALTKSVLLVESQVGPDCNAKIDWGTNTMQQQVMGTFSLIDETEQFANPLGSVTGIALCPSPAAIVWILKALGFPRVEILTAPENGYEQFTSGNRVMVAAYTAESA